MPKGDESLDALRDAIRRRGQADNADEAQRFQALAREYEAAVGQLVAHIREVVAAVPELTLATEDEKEAFTSPAFPGRTLDIRDQRVRITRGEDYLLFDPTAGALASAVGQVRLSSSRPIPLLMEKTLYLVRGGPDGTWWGYRSAEDPSKFAVPFTPKALVRMLHAVFA
jgi:hypothetical protein